MLFLDQRGTGLSSTLTAGTLARQGDAIKQAEYLKNFRADSIVRDCEAIRDVLTQDYPADQRRWSILGQSFGGFCAVTYLSKLYVLRLIDLHTWILNTSLISFNFQPGGLERSFPYWWPSPPDQRAGSCLCEDLWCASLFSRSGLFVTLTQKIEKVKERNEAYYQKFPEDVARVKNIMQYLTKNKVALPSGLLTPARFQQLGIMFGFHGKSLDSDSRIKLTRLRWF